MSNITIRVISALDELEAMADIWDKLLQQSEGCNSLFLTYEWLSTVYHHYGNGTKLNIIVIEKDRQPIGIFPFNKAIYRLGFIKFHVLETIGTQNDNPAGFFLDEHRNEVFDAFMGYLRNELKSSNAVVKLELVPEDCAFSRQLRTRMQETSTGLKYMEKTVTLAPYIKISGTFDQYIKSLSKNRRKRLRRVLKNADLNHNVEYGQVDSGNLKEELKTLFELHSKRWKLLNINSPFNDIKMQRFYNEIAECFQKTGWLHFTFLRVDGAINSLIFAFIYNRKLYSATIARNTEYPELNLGHLHHYYLIKEAFDLGLTEFDFLRGDELHKFHWAHQWRNYQRIIITGDCKFPKYTLKYKNAVLRLIEIINHRHSPAEILGLISYQIKNRKTVKRIVSD
jgi:CelD/BcsL family acetyltransferase involved in cellulose biosynthesis